MKNNKFIEIHDGLKKMNLTKISLRDFDRLYRALILGENCYVIDRDGEHFRLASSPFFPEIECSRLHEPPKSTDLPPTCPRTIFGFGENFCDPPSSRPVKDRIFIKPLNTLAGPESTLSLPPDSNRTFFEGELVAVIGRKSRRLSLAEAREAIVGYTVGNDFSEDGWFREDCQWWRVKGVDGYSPVGPAVVIGFDWRNARVVTSVNGDTRQDAPLDKMTVSPEEILCEITKYVTLVPGDLVFLGTPPGASEVRVGDIVEVSINGLGSLTTYISNKAIAQNGDNTSYSPRQNDMEHREEAPGATGSTLIRSRCTGTSRSADH